MKRRKFLQTSGLVASSTLLLAGCLEAPTKDTAQTTPEVNITAQTLPDGVDAEVVFKSNNHKKHPLQIAFSLTNQSDSDYVYGEAREAQFVAASDGPFVLYPSGMFSTPKTYKFNESVNVWVATQQYAQTMEFAVDNLEAGTSDTQSLTLLHQKPEGIEAVEPYPKKLEFTADFEMAVNKQEGIGGDLANSEGFNCSVTIEIIPP